MFLFALGVESTEVSPSGSLPPGIIPLVQPQGPSSSRGPAGPSGQQASGTGHRVREWASLALPMMTYMGVRSRLGQVSSQFDTFAAEMESNFYRPRFNGNRRAFDRLPADQRALNYSNGQWNALPPEQQARWREGRKAFGLADDFRGVPRKDLVTKPNFYNKSGLYKNPKFGIGGFLGAAFGAINLFFIGNSLWVASQKSGEVKKSVDNYLGSMESVSGIRAEDRNRIRDIIEGNDRYKDKDTDVRMNALRTILGNQRGVSPEVRDKILQDAESLMGSQKKCTLNIFGVDTGIDIGLATGGAIGIGAGIATILACCNPGGAAALGTIALIKAGVCGASFGAMATQLASGDDVFGLGGILDGISKPNVPRPLLTDERRSEGFETSTLPT